MSSGLIYLILPPDPDELERYSQNNPALASHQRFIAVLAVVFARSSNRLLRLPWFAVNVREGQRRIEHGR